MANTKISADVGVSLNKSCKKLIDNFISEMHYPYFIREQMRIRVTDLVEKCIWSDSHED